MVYLNVAEGALTTTTSDTIITDMIATIGDTLASGLPIVLAFLAILIGLFFVLRYIWKKVGRAKG